MIKVFLSPILLLATIVLFLLGAVVKVISFLFFAATQPLLEFIEWIGFIYYIMLLIAIFGLIFFMLQGSATLKDLLMLSIGSGILLSIPHWLEEIQMTIEDILDDIADFFFCLIGDVWTF